MVRGIRSALRHRNAYFVIYDPIFEAGVFWGITKQVLGIDKSYGK